MFRQYFTMTSAHRDLLLELRERHRRRVYAMNQRLSMDNMLGAMVRSLLGWSLALPKAERDRIKEEAAAEVNACEVYVRAERRAREKGKEPPAQPRDFGFILPTIAARAPFAAIEAMESAAIEELAQKLPIWPKFSEVRGLGPLGIGIIHAEAVVAREDIAGLFPDYERVSQLYKRLGLAVFDGHAQGRVPKQMPREQRKEAWIARGYSPMRRSRLWTIGASLIKLNGDDGRYRGLYLRRKAYERERAEANGIQVVPASKIPKGKEGGYISLQQVDRRAQRVMEKQLVEDMWNAWREAAARMPELAKSGMPPAAQPG